MCQSITIILSVLMAYANGRYLKQDDYRSPYLFVEDGRNIRAYDLEEALSQDPHDRHGASLTGQHKPGFADQLTAAGKYNLLHEDKHDISAQAFATRTFPSNPNIPNYDTYGGMIGYTYDDKHVVSLGGQHIPDLGYQFTAAGKFNLLHNDEHDITAQAFATRIFPSNPNIPNFDIYSVKV
ncbi:unnamed protein product [Parnassius apollo]|uniref:(apollo) hypothetical protein n=1 Tax=Parnassius apollo TaxID=110799 RepID=A0A8S3W7D4_PARAO|nr:unnamed protein product [Parnassius apollo]